MDAVVRGPAVSEAQAFKDACKFHNEAADFKSSYKGSGVSLRKLPTMDAIQPAPPLPSPGNLPQPAARSPQPAAPLLEPQSYEVLKMREMRLRLQQAVEQARVTRFESRRLLKLAQNARVDALPRTCSHSTNRRAGQNDAGK
jgi:hypothetical protein